MKRYFRKLAFLLLMGTYGHASAVVDCTGTVTNLSLQLDAGATLTLALSGGPSFTYLCDFNGSRNGVPAVVCRTIYATLIAAKLTGKKVLMRFYDYATCDAVPAWANAGTVGWTQLLLD